MIIQKPCTLEAVELVSQGLPNDLALGQSWVGPLYGDSPHIFSDDETKKTGGALLSVESWLVNRDPYNGLLSSLYGCFQK